MGIQGLIPLLKSIHRQRHIKDFSGQTVGIDAYGWLHRGAIACAIDLALGKPTQKYVDFCMHRVRMLLHFGVTPYLVFDGDYLPSKASTELAREARREETRKLGLDLLAQKKTSEAYTELRKAIDVTPTMAAHVIAACRALNVQCVVAPYEADAQLYYMERTGIISGIISEDSDLLVFGAKSLITKLGEYGDCVEINRADFASNKDVSLAGWSNEEFRMMAILSGCDYLENIPNIGLRTAYGLVRKHKTIDRIIKVLRFDGKYSVPTEYEIQFEKAETTFRHQRVWCPVKEQMVMCNDAEEGALTSEQLVYIGPELEHTVARSVAEGKMDPITKTPIVLDGPLVKGSQPQPKRSYPEPVKPENRITSFFRPQTTPQRPKTLEKTKDDGLKSAPTVPSRSTTAPIARPPSTPLPTKPVSTPLKRPASVESPPQPAKKTSVCFDDDSLPEFSPFFGPPKTSTTTPKSARTPKTPTSTAMKKSQSTQTPTKPTAFNSSTKTLQQIAMEKSEKALAALTEAAEVTKTPATIKAAASCTPSSFSKPSLPKPPVRPTLQKSSSDLSEYKRPVLELAPINKYEYGIDFDANKENIDPKTGKCARDAEETTYSLAKDTDKYFDSFPQSSFEIYEDPAHSSEVETNKESDSIKKVAEGWKAKFSFATGTTTKSSSISRSTSLSRSTTKTTTTSKLTTTTKTIAKPPLRRSTSGLSDRTASFNGQILTDSVNSISTLSYSKSTSSATPKRRTTTASGNSNTKENQRPGSASRLKAGRIESPLSGPVEWPEFVGSQSKAGGLKRTASAASLAGLKRTTSVGSLKSLGVGTGNRR